MNRKPRNRQFNQRNRRTSIESLERRNLFAADLLGGAESVRNDAEPLPELNEVHASEYLSLHGDASIVGETTSNEIQLTPAAGSQIGTAVSTKQIDISENFSLDFDVYLGSRNGADGMTFVLHNDPSGPSAVGNAGYALGAHGIRDGIALEFDTYRNWTDMNADHTAVWDTDTGVARWGQFISDPDHLISPQAFGELEDGQWRNVQVTWNAQSQTFAYEIDGREIGSAVVDLANEHFGGSSLVHFGWTASTGGLNNVHSVRVNGFDGAWVGGTFRTETVDVSALADDIDATTRFDVSNVNAGDYISLIGDADLVDSGNEIRLTEARHFQRGGAMSQDRIDVSSDFAFDFDVYLGDKNGADGVNFVLHNDPEGINAIGAVGHGMGADGIQNGIAVEFDTYKNMLDMHADHTSIWDTDSGVTAGGQFVVDPNYLASPKAIADLEDGEWHTVTIAWDADSQTLAYAVDGRTINTATADLANDYFDGSSLVHFGWTGSTGGLTNVHAVRVNSIAGDWQTDSVHSEHSLAATSEINGHVYVDLDDDQSRSNSDVGIGSVQVTLTGSDNTGQAIQRATLTNADGSYSFENLVPGSYDLQVENVDWVLNPDANEIAGIQLESDSTASGYDFRKLDDGRLVETVGQDFSRVVVFNGTNGDDSFDFVADDQRHIATLNDVAYSLDATEVETVLFYGRSGTDSVTSAGTAEAEKAELRETSGSVTSASYGLHTFDTESFHASGGEGADRAFLYDSAGDDEFYGTAESSRLFGDTFDSQASSFGHVFVVTSGGVDQAEVVGTDGRDTLRGAPDRSVVFSDNYYISLHSFDDVSVTAGQGGVDIATLTDSAGDDYFVAHQEAGSLSGTGYSLRATGFDRVTAIATEGNDTADLYDSTGNDRYYAKPGWNRMLGAGFDNRAEGFQQVAGHAVNGGNVDRVFLYDSLSSDQLVVSPDSAEMTADGFQNTANAFERVYAYATPGTDDSATFYDSVGDDIFKVAPGDARMHGAGYYIFAKDFSGIEGYASSGYDRVYLTDSAGDDTLTASENELQMTGDGFQHSASGFDRAYAWANNGGHDRAIFNDTNAADTFITDADTTRMYGADYYNKVHSFDEVDVNVQNFDDSDRVWFDGTRLTDFNADEAQISLHESLYRVVQSPSTPEEARTSIDLALADGIWS